MKNYIENLFELIRNEEVIIFAGAGLSIYAGFPSGTKLNEIIYNELTLTEKEEISKHLSLPELTEQFCRIKNNNRNQLIQILKKTFLKKPEVKPTFHHKISSIPHIKTVITTNYDRLFEQAYGDDAQLICSEKQLSLIDKSKVEIFKIHGDLFDPESIIISQSDYNNFFKKETEKNLYWSIIKERLATKNVLFLGYNLEDPNVSIVFEKITEVFETNRREAFLIAPELSKHKQNDLIRKGINYIDSKAETIIDELFENIKLNIATDLEKSKVKPDTFHKFLKNLELTPDLKGESDGLKLTRIRGLNGQIEGKLNLVFKKDSNIANKFLDFSHGKEFGEFELSDKELEELKIGFGGIQMPDFKGAYKLKFIDQPRFDTKVDIRFGDGFEYEDFPVKVYGSAYKVEILANIPFIDMKIEIDPSTFPDPVCNFTYQHKKICSKLSNEIKFFEFLSRLSAGSRISIFRGSNKIADQKGPMNKDLSLDSKIYLDYFKNLKLIEKNYNIKFDDIDFDTINDTLIKKVNEIKSILNDGFYEIELNYELVVKLNKVNNQTIKQLELIGTENHKFEYLEKMDTIYEIHGQEINLGIKSMEFIDPQISNLSKIKTDRIKDARIISNVGKAKVSYSQQNLTSP